MFNVLVARVVVHNNYQTNYTPPKSVYYKAVFMLKTKIEGQSIIHYLIDHLQPLGLPLSTLVCGVPIEVGWTTWMIGPFQLVLQQGGLFLQTRTIFQFQIPWIVPRLHNLQSQHHTTTH